MKAYDEHWQHGHSRSQIRIFESQEAEEHTLREIRENLALTGR